MAPSQKSVEPPTNSGPLKAAEKPSNNVSMDSVGNHMNMTNIFANMNNSAATAVGVSAVSPMANGTSTRESGTSKSGSSTTSDTSKSDKSSTYSRKSKGSDSTSSYTHSASRHMPNRPFAPSEKPYPASLLANHTSKSVHLNSTIPTLPVMTNSTAAAALMASTVPPLPLNGTAPTVINSAVPIVIYATGANNSAPPAMLNSLYRALNTTVVQTIVNSIGPAMANGSLSESNRSKYSGSSTYTTSGTSSTTSYTSPSVYDTGSSMDSASMSSDIEPSHSGTTDSQTYSLSSNALPMRPFVLPPTNSNSTDNPADQSITSSPSATSTASSNSSSSTSASSQSDQNSMVPSQGQFNLPNLNMPFAPPEMRFSPPNVPTHQNSRSSDTSDTSNSSGDSGSWTSDSQSDTGTLYSVPVTNRPFAPSLYVPNADVKSSTSSGSSSYPSDSDSTSESDSTASDTSDNSAANVTPSYRLANARPMFPGGPPKAFHSSASSSDAFLNMPGVPSDKSASTSNGSSSSSKSSTSSGDSSSPSSTTKSSATHSIANIMPGVPSVMLSSDQFHMLRPTTTTVKPQTAPTSSKAAASENPLVTTSNPLAFSVLNTASSSMLPSSSRSSRSSLSY